MHKFSVTEPARLDAFLAQKLPSFSRSQLQNSISKAEVRVNGISTLKPSTKLKIGDSVELQDEPQPLTLTPQPFTLPILFEDSDLLVINKPAGLVVHPTTAEHTDSVAHQLLSYVPGVKASVHDSEDPISLSRPGIVHRLDKDTTGVLVIAKTPEALKNLSEQFHSHRTHKAYTAVVYGAITEDQTIAKNLVRRGNTQANKMKAVTTSEGRTAITHVYPLEIHPDSSYTVVSCVIETGRTHQIRAHLVSIGHPVLGDSLYATKPSAKLSESLGITRQLLHAASLTITHPKTGKPATFTAPLPPDIAELFDRAETCLVAY